MKSRYPNRSVLSILTCGEKPRNHSASPDADQEVHAILFVYVKPVPDFLEGDKFYWMHEDRRGGKPGDLWPELGIRHWLAFGNDETIATKYKTLLVDKILDVGEYRLILPDVVRSVEDWTDPNILQGLKAESLVISDPGRLSPAFCHEENLAALSGYRTNNTKIQPVKPAGFFAPDFLFNHVAKNIIGYREYRTSHLSFRGVRTTRVEGKGSTQLIGFYQKNFSDAEQLQAIARNKDGDIIGRGRVNKETGLFKMDLLEPSMSGVMQIEECEGIEFSTSYTLLQGIRGSVNFVEKTFRDTYGREFNLGGKGVIRPQNIQASSWYGPYYADEKTAEMKLSDKFKELFDYLGPTVLIADPYFLGPFRKDKSTGTILFSPCQVAFFASVIRSVVDGAVKELNILGFNQRANLAEGKEEETLFTKTESRFKDYEKVFINLSHSNKLQSYFKDFRLEFLNNSKDFHNRYWFGINSEGGVRKLEKCVTVTNSIGNISEVDFFPVQQDAQLRELTARYLSFLNNAKSELIL